MLDFIGIGSALALLLAGIAYIVAKNRHHAPGKKTGEWLLTGAVILMLLAGVEMTFAGAGLWITGLLLHVTGMLGPIGMVIATILGLVMLVRIVVAVFRDASEQAMWTALMFPFVCAIFHTGLFHAIDVNLAPAAQALTTQAESWFGV